MLILSIFSKLKPLIIRFEPFSCLNWLLVLVHVRGFLKFPCLFCLWSGVKQEKKIWSSLIWYDNCKKALPHERKIMLISCTFNNNVIFFRRTILEKYFWPLDCRQNWSLNYTVRPFIADFVFWSMCYMSKLGAKFPALLVDENIIRSELLSFFYIINFN